MIAKCPYCNAEMEGDAVIGDLIECPICLATFTLEQKHVIPEEVSAPAALTSRREGPPRPANPGNSSIDRYLTGERRSRRFEHLPALIVVGLLLAVGGVFASKMDFPWKMSLPWSKKQHNVNPSGEIARVFSSSQGKASTTSKAKGGASFGNGKRHRLTEAEKVFKEALDAMLGENGEQRDIVKAFGMFEKARDMKYALAEVALAHIAWNMSDENKKAFEESGRQSPARFFYSIYPGHPILPAWVLHSSVAKFEQGLYQMRLSGSNRTNQEGMMLIAQAANEGVAIAKRFLNSMMGDEVRQGLDVSEATFTAHLVLMHNPELVSYYQHECDSELKKEFLRSIGEMDD